MYYLNKYSQNAPLPKAFRELCFPLPTTLLKTPSIRVTNLETLSKNLWHTIKLFSSPKVSLMHESWACRHALTFSQQRSLLSKIKICDQELTPVELIEALMGWQWLMISPQDLTCWTWPSPCLQVSCVRKNLWGHH